MATRHRISLSPSLAVLLAAALAVPAARALGAQAATEPALISVRAAATQPASAPSTQSADDPRAAILAFNHAARDLDAGAASVFFTARTPAEKHLLDTLLAAIRVEKRLRASVVDKLKVNPADLPPPMLITTGPDADFERAAIVVTGDEATVAGLGNLRRMVRVNGRWQVALRELVTDPKGPPLTDEQVAARLERMSQDLDRLVQTYADIASDVDKGKFETSTDVFETLKVEMQAATPPPAK